MLKKLNLPVRKLNLRSRKICKFLLTIQVRIVEQIKRIKKLSKVIQVSFIKHTSADESDTKLVTGFKGGQQKWGEAIVPVEGVEFVQYNWECEAARTKTNGILKIEKLYNRDSCFRYMLPRVSQGFSRTEDDRPGGYGHDQG